MQTLDSFLMSMISSGTPILFALMGDLVGQQTGIISLSVEGSMLMGACAGFAAAAYTNSLILTILAAALAGALIGLIQAFLVVSRKANMLASGLTLIFFAQGITGFAGRHLLTKEIAGFDKVAIPFLSRIPIIGVFFNQDPITYLSYFSVVILYLVLNKTRFGFELRATGHNKESVEAYGINPKVMQYAAVIFAGLMAGIGGAHLSTAYTMSWVDNISGGRGLIASALVILCGWSIEKSMLAAYLFGGAQALQILLQMTGIKVPTYLMLMLPYVVTIISLAIVSVKGKAKMPEELTKISELSHET